MALGGNKRLVLRDVDMACIKSAVYFTGMMYDVYFMFCWPYILVRLWVNGQLDAQLRYIKSLLL